MKAGPQMALKTCGISGSVVEDCILHLQAYPQSAAQVAATHAGFLVPAWCFGRRKRIVIYQRLLCCGGY
jgi:hypothetical protein